MQKRGTASLLVISVQRGNKWYGFLSFEDNYKRQADERKKGIDNRVNLAVYKLDKNTEEIIEEYHSISEAARKNNLEKANISKICNNYKTKKYKTKYQTCGGFKWKFKD